MPPAGWQMPAPHPAPLVPQPRPLPPDATVGGLAFHRLVFARRRSGWWTPLAVGALGTAIYIALLIVVLIGVFIAGFVSPGLVDGLMEITTSAMFDLTDPLVMALALGTIALMLPAYLLASLIVSGARVGLISSAAGRLRWRWMLLCSAVAVGVAVVVTALSMLIPGEGEAGGAVPPTQNPQLWATLIVLLLIVPLQAAAEEYVFRGYLMQAIGRWLRHPAFAILLPVPLFVLGHLYDPLGQAAVAAFAVGAGWLTWRTGGLEAAIGLHVVNNLLAFLTALAGFGDVNDSSPGLLSLVFSIVLVGGYTALVELLFRRSGMARTLVLTPPPAPVWSTRTNAPG